MDWRAVLVAGAFLTPGSMGFEAARVTAPRGEDGTGRVITATNPVALDVTAERFPARALDPVLHVGAVRFVHYTFPERGVMRFVAADMGVLIPGTEVALQWGDERVVLSASLEVPR